MARQASSREDQGPPACLTESVSQLHDHLPDQAARRSIGTRYGTHGNVPRNVVEVMTAPHTRGASTRGGRRRRPRGAARGGRAKRGGVVLGWRSSSFSGFRAGRGPVDRRIKPGPGKKVNNYLGLFPRMFGKEGLPRSNPWPETCPRKPDSLFPAAGRFPASSLRTSQPTSRDLARAAFTCEMARVLQRLTRNGRRRSIRSAPINSGSPFMTETLDDIADQTSLRTNVGTRWKNGGLKPGKWATGYPGRKPSWRAKLRALQLMDQTKIARGSRRRPSPTKPGGPFP